MQSLYKTFVRLHLEFSSCVSSPFYQKTIDTLERVQRRMTRLIPSLRHLDYEERLERLRLPTLRLGRVRYDMIQTF